MTIERRIDLARQIGQAVRDRREELDMTQAELACSAGVSRTFVIRLEKGRAQAVVPQKVLDVLDALGLSLFVRPVDRDEVPPRRAAAQKESAADAYLEGLRFDPSGLLGRGARDGH